MHGAPRVDVSERESEVLSAIGEHLSNVQIAHRLHISVRTVESHVSSLLRKYGAANRRELVAHAPDAASPRSARPILGIPASPTSFVGRERERDAVLAALGEPGLVTVVGPGGMGKTRLAAVVAGGTAASFPAGGAFVDLVPVGSGLVAHAVADALGVVERPPTPLVRTLLDRLSAGRALLVLDNCEQLVDEVGALVAEMLAGSPGLFVLATSRERLAVPGERVIRLPPLPLASDAERLFTHRARAVDPEFEADPSAVSQLCADLDGMPLAIELAASRAGSLGVDGLRSALDDRLRLLAGGRHHDPRHRSMRAVVGWSYELLDPDERSLFRRLSVFVGGFDLDAAVAVSAGMSRSTVADLVGRLADKSMVVHHRQAATSRWRMLEILRAFARDELAGAGEVDDVGRRRLAWAAQTAADLEDRIGGEWRSEFDAVVDDLRAASASAGPAPDPTAYRLARSLAHLTFAKRAFVEAREHYRAAADRAGDPRAAVAELRRAAATAIAVSDQVAAFQLLLDAAALAEAAGADDLHAVALAEAVIVTHRFSVGLTSAVPPGRASVLLQQAAAAADPSDLRAAAMLAAARAWERGADEVDPDLARMAVDAAQRVGEPHLVAAALDALGIAATRTGRMREAHRIATDRLRIVESLPDHEPSVAVEMVDAHYVAAVYALCAGDLPAALAVGQRPGVTDPLGEHPYLGLQSVQALALSGRFPEAIERATTMWDDWRRNGSPVQEWLSPHAAAAALAHGMLGDLEQFEVWRTRACELARVDDPAASRYLAAFSAFVDARVAIHAGRFADAARLVDRAFAGFRRRWHESYARVTGAELAVAAALPDASDRLAAAAHHGPENDWAAACLARARGRLDGDPAAIAAAAAGFERIGARAERACALVLLPDRADEGRAELRRLGCAVPRPGVA
ncbi:LuxR C-terminal-related transcriptional regulator [Pseudonocardia cypriaca]|uniref:LuxR C-terminal-related transcriptional regulator n=1 Tax=Pseudonocardia cypriaca TaxID=882449 RepID=UPI0014772818|nr:LuxR C-terminal-related transcriptional regulator [Pseudonocardia cypriaca]